MGDFVIENGVLKKYAGPAGDVVIPDGVTEIDAECFAGKRSIVSISIPKSVAKIVMINFKKSPFSGCSGLQNICVEKGNRSYCDVAGVLFNKKKTMLVCCPAGKKGAYTVPAGVREIGKKAFRSCSRLTDICLPNGLETIDSEAFYGCTGLAAINLPESVTEIGAGAFRDCAGLAEIVIPAKVKGIWRRAFYGCSSLTRVVFSGNAYVDKGAFGRCGRIASVLTPDEPKTYFYNDAFEMPLLVFAYLQQGGEMTGKAKKAVHAYIKKHRIEIAEELIGSDVGGALTRFLAVWGKAPLDELDEYIDMAVKAGRAVSAAELMECKRIQYPPQAQAAAEQDAMDKALGLKKRTVAEWKKLLRFKDTEDGLVITGNKSRGAAMEIPDVIGKKSVIAIALEGDLAYDTIERISIPASVTSITGLSCAQAATGITVAEDNPVFCAVDGVLFSKERIRLIRYPAGLSGEYTIPESVTIIGERAFSSCVGLTKVTIPAGVTSIGELSFGWCESLAAVNIPDSVTSIGESAFSSCSSLKSITIPEGVVKIGGGAFSNCNDLAAVVIPASVTDFGRDVFACCQNLKSVVIREGATFIGEGAFSRCSSLASVTIPDSVTHIRGFAFWGCTSLTDINIPDSMTRIGDLAFRGCAGLADEQGLVIVRGVLYDCVKKDAVSVTIPAGVTGIGFDAFEDCERLQSVTIPEGVRSIGYGAFSRCSSLTAMMIPQSVTEMDRYAFFGCCSLTSVTLPDSVTKIGEKAFRGCSSLTSVTIPESVTSIGSEAFRGCPSLTIHAPAGSCAEEYAKKNNIPFEPI